MEARVVVLLVVCLLEDIIMKAFLLGLLLLSVAACATPSPIVCPPGQVVDDRRGSPTVGQCVVIHPTPRG